MDKPTGPILPPSDPSQRPEWDVYFMELALLARRRSTCLRRQVGAVLVASDRSVLATGYNGAPKGLAHASEVGCLRDQLEVPSGERHELCRGLHAEQNAIIQAARHGVSISGTTLYCTTHPCAICIKMLINAEISQIFFLDGYADEMAKRIIAEARIPITQLPMVERYNRL